MQVYKVHNIAADVTGVMFPTKNSQTENVHFHVPHTQVISRTPKQLT